MKTPHKLSTNIQRIRDTEENSVKNIAKLIVTRRVALSKYLKDFIERTKYKGTIYTTVLCILLSTVSKYNTGVRTVKLRVLILETYQSSSVHDKYT